MTTIQLIELLKELTFWQIVNGVWIISVKLWPFYVLIFVFCLFMASINIFKQEIKKRKIKMNKS